MSLKLQQKKSNLQREESDDQDSSDDGDGSSNRKNGCLKENNSSDEDSDDDSRNTCSSLDSDDSDEVQDKLITVYSWEPSPKFVREDALLNGWIAIHRRSHSVRSIGPWEVLKHSSTGTLFYWHPIENRFQCALPVECRWSGIDEMSKFLGQVGKRDEWDVLRSIEGSIYYRTNDNMWIAPADKEEEGSIQRTPTSKYLSRRTPARVTSIPTAPKTMVVSYRWDEPLFALEKAKIPGLCTITTTNSPIPQKILQGYYTCDQCHQSGSGQRGRVRNIQSMPKYCTSCAAVCHQGHRGLRYVKKAFFICECDTCPGGCLNKDMKARESRENLLAGQQLADDRRIDQDLEHSPPELAFVPPRATDTQGDWSICRRVPEQETINGFITFYDPKPPQTLGVGSIVLGPVSGWYGEYEGIVIGLPAKESSNRYTVEYHIKDHVTPQGEVDPVQIASNPQSSSSTQESPAVKAQELPVVIKRELVSM